MKFEYIAHRHIRVCTEKERHQLLMKASGGHSITEIDFCLYSLDYLTASAIHTAI